MVIYHAPNATQSENVFSYNLNKYECTNGSGTVNVDVHYVSLCYNHARLINQQGMQVQQECKYL